ncbi:hypothetical protein PSHT_14065, partial [Puccinia striiformis]
MTGTNQAEDNQSATMTIAKRIQPGALTVDKGRNTARPIPAFLTKLYTMVNDSSTDHLIKWNKPNGDSFFVVSSERFGRELLPKYFKHSNFGSFVRQLNMYGFHKVPHLNQGVLQGEIPETEMLEFTNINFQRAQPDLLCLIQRKKSCPESTHPATNEPNEPSSTAVPPNTNTTPPNTADLQTILMDIIIRHSSHQISRLQSSNAHLWKEAIANRDRIKRCQDTIKNLGLLSPSVCGKGLKPEDPPLGNSGQSSSNRTGILREHPLQIPTDPSTDNPSNLGPTLDHSSSLQNLSTNRNHPRRLSSHSILPSYIFHHPKHGQSSTQFQDSSIDPNLETSTEINGANTQSNQNPIDGSTTDDQQSSPDAVFQALFNNNNSSSSAGLNMNNSSMNGINWADLISSNGLNGFTEDMIESNPSNITSPLHKSDLLANNNMNNGNLNLSFLGSHLSDNNNNNQIDNIDQNDFDTDAFLRTLISSEDKTQSTSNSRLLSFREQEGEAEDSAEDNILKEMITSSSTGPNSTTLTTTRGIDQFRSPGKAKEIVRINESNNGGDTMDRLDIEKFLDEWTPHEDHSRILSGLTPMIMSPVSTPTTDLTQNLPRNTSSTSIPSIPIPNHNNHNLDRSASSVHSRKRLLDDSVPISDQTSTAHLFNLLNSSENHHHNPTFNSLTTNPSSSNSNLIHNKKTRL